MPNSRSGLDIAPTAHPSPSRFSALACEQTNGLPLVTILAQALRSPSPLAELTLELGKLANAHACLLLQANPNRDQITAILWHASEVPSPATVSLHSPFPQGQGQFQMAQTLLAQISTDLPLATWDWQAGVGTLLQGTGIPLNWLDHIQTYLPIPVATPESLTGMVLMMSASPSRVNQEDRTMLAAISDSLALAFQHHDLQQQVQQSRQDVQHLSHLKEDFISTLNHELRTPLTSMMLAIRMLHRPDLTPARASMYLDILEQQCTREISLVNDLLLVQTVETTAPCPSPDGGDGNPPVRLQDALTVAVESQQAAFVAANRHLQLEISQPWLSVVANGPHLVRVLQELLTNARKFSEPDSTVTVAVATDGQTPDAVIIRVTNIGTGILPEEVPYLFDKFRRGKTATRDAIPGTGIGLALVQGLVRQMGGRVTVSSHPTASSGHWQTCFTLELVQAVMPAMVMG